jgi:hypothetical protein
MTSPLPSRLLDLADPFLRALADRRPTLAALFTSGQPSLLAFLRTFRDAALPAMQDRNDYIEAVATTLLASQGQDAARRARTRLQDSPVVYTANHLCLESMPLTVQSMVLAGLVEPADGILPVEACGLIPADNASYPSGLLLDRIVQGKLLRLPILDLSKRQRRQMTLGLEGFRAVDLARAARRVDEMTAEGTLSAAMRDALHRVLNEILGSPDVLGADRFLRQAERANPRLWQAWYAPEVRGDVRPLAYLTSETLRQPLLLADLQDRSSLIARVLFEPELRTDLLRRLNGVPCCWTDEGRSGGTAFFWAVTTEGRTVPLALQNDALIGDEGPFPLEPDALLEAVETGRLVPSIFLNLTLGLARGLIQIGGFSQLDYLARMQQGIADALAHIGDTASALRLGPPLPPMFTAGLAGLAVKHLPEGIVSAGGLSLIAHGGLTRRDLDRLHRLTLADAMLLELPGLTRMVVGDEAFRALPLPSPEAWAALLESRLPLM